MDGLAEEVTIVLVTSFTAAAPSTSLIEATVRSFGFVPGLEHCTLIVVCDGFRKFHRRRTKAGRLLEEDAVPYAAYCAALQALAANAQSAGASSSGSWAHAHVLVLQEHHGFGWAIKAALESGLVRTRQILVVQHDRAFMRTFDLARAVRCMHADERVRYLLIPTRSTHNHAKTIFGRCGAVLPAIEVAGVRLRTLGFWWDSTHLATASHYRDFVFAQKCVKKGSFPEDTLGRQMLDALKSNGVDALAPYGAYLWADEGDETECRVVGHLNGAHWRAWTTEAAEGGAAAIASGKSVGGGCGFAKNRAVEQSAGEWLCFQDVDDVSWPERLQTQLAAARGVGPNCLIGCRVVREPEGSTARYTSWANGMSAEELSLHRFRECTLLMPTWFISRSAFDGNGGFREEKCEDMLFLQAHVHRGGSLHRCDEVLVTYRYHADAATHAIPRQLLLKHRAEAIERAVLSGWQSFTIWGAGRDGRDFFKALSPECRRRVAAFCDVDEKKIGTTYQFFEFHVPIIHFAEATPPMVICVALDRTGGAFEANLASLQLVEGKDFYHFG